MLVGKPEGKRQLVRSKYVWEGNIETNLQEVIWGDMDCINLAQDMESWQLVINELRNILVYYIRGIS